MKPTLACAIYTRKSSEEGLEQGFNSLDAQREACAAFILSQKAEGWRALPDAYDDGGYSGGNTERPGLVRLMQDIAAGRVKVVVVYKVDRLTRSLADFAKLVEQFDAQGVSFVSVTQQFNTTSSMGRLTLNVLLSFAQFEREVTGERIRDKIAASKRKGMWMGGNTPVGYRSNERTLVIDEPQAERIREIFRQYLTIGCIRRLKAEIDRRGWVTPKRTSRRESHTGGRLFSRGHLYRMLSNPIYRGLIAHKGEIFLGLHPAIIDQDLWDQVQATLDGNRQGHKGRKNVKSPSPLAGKVFDGSGERLTPTHACKGNQRYRYYVTHSLVGEGKSDTRVDSNDLRIPAPELEGAVRQVLINYLNDPQRLLADVGHVTAEAYQGMVDRSKQNALILTGGTLKEQIVLYNHLIDHIVVGRSGIDIRLNRSALAGEPAGENVLPICVTLPVRFQRSGFGIRLVIPGSGKAVTRQVDTRLISFVQRGVTWFRRLVTERMGPSEIAREEGVSASLVQRIIPVAFLAPDIVKATEAGKHPASLTADSLLKALPLPACWKEQRRVLGIAI
jgi:DNA invertase Pin-like site-specific DNA recombinase